MKKHVDQFKPGELIPHCHLKAEMTNKHKKSASILVHQVKLVGAKDPFKFITIHLDPQRTLPGQITPVILLFYRYCNNTI